MRYQSLKRGREARALEPELERDRETFDVCQIPGCRSRSTAIHEIVRGGSRWTARHQRACRLHLCEPCHRDLQNMPLVFQCAVKLAADKDGFSLPKILEVKGWAPAAMDLAEIEKIAWWLRRKFLSERGF